MAEVSVIVPVYKVEKYIHRCVDSILNQTFQNFELILVDDGSPDHCGAICEEYALNGKYTYKSIPQCNTAAHPHMARVKAQALRPVNAWKRYGFTGLLEKHGLVRDRHLLQLVAGLTLYPEDYLCPKDERGGLTNRTKNTYSIHFDASWFEESWKEGQKKRWRQEKIRYILKTPNRVLMKVLGQGRYDRLKAMLKRK